MSARAGVDAELRDELRRTARDLLSARAGGDLLRRIAAGDDDGGALWREVAALGWVGVEVPEDHDGLGAGTAELCVLLEEIGRALAPVPLLSAALAARALLAAGPATRERWLAPLLAGSARAAVALTDARGATGVPGVVARRDDDGWRLDGVSGYALDLPAASLAIVAARVEQGGEAAFVVDLDAAGAQVEPQQLHDVSRPCGRLTLEGVRVETADALAGGGALVGELVDRGALALAAEAVGGAERALEMTIEHLRARHQFGRPLGSFQALKHRCADVHLRILAARAAVEHAAVAVARDDERPLAVAIAKVKACEAYVLAATEAVQMHGAIGFTWEHDAHLHLKRAKLAEALLGDPDHQRDRVAALALPGAAT